MKLVVDTNTIISGSLWQGPPARLISAALAGQGQMFLSLPMLLELQQTFQHPKFATRLAAQGETPVSMTARFRAACLEAVPARIMPPADLRDTPPFLQFRPLDRSARSQSDAALAHR